MLRLLRTLLALGALALMTVPPLAVADGGLDSTMQLLSPHHLWKYFYASGIGPGFADENPDTQTAFYLARAIPVTIEYSDVSKVFLRISKGGAVLYEDFLKVGEPGECLKGQVTYAWTPPGSAGAIDLAGEYHFLAVGPDCVTVGSTVLDEALITLSAIKGVPG